MKKRLRKYFEFECKIADSCLGYIVRSLQHPPTIFGLLVVAPCEDEISCIKNNWLLNPINDESNIQKCVDIPPPLQTPIESATAVVKRNFEYPLNCHPHFYFMKYSDTIYCLHQLKHSGEEKFNFVWSVCDINQPEQRWVNVGSKNNPGSIQICQAFGEKNNV